LSRFRTYRVGRVRLRSRGRTDRPTGGHQKHGGRTAVHSLSWNRPLCDATITLSGGMGHTPCPSRWPALVPARQAPRPASSPRGGALYRAGKWRGTGITQRSTPRCWRAKFRCVPGLEFTPFGCFRNNPAAKFQVQRKTPAEATPRPAGGACVTNGLSPKTAQAR